MLGRLEHRTLYAFLASPGDLAAERNSAADVVERVNRALSKHTGIRIELLGWEHSRPGYGRPQAQINADLDLCDLFVGLLWERWGEPTGDDKHTSGFEEEFERTLERRRATGSPEMWVYFKDVDPERQGDAGPQLSKVLEFRERLRSEKELKYHEFADTAAWTSDFFEHLTGHLGALSGAEQRQEEAISRDVSKPTVIHPTSEEHPAAQTASALEAAREAVSGAEPSAAGSAIDDVSLARLYLAASTWMWERSGGVLGNHEVNFVYRFRRDVEPLEAERTHIMRALTEDSGRPGWFWFRDVPAGEVAGLLMSTAMGFADDDVRVRALRLLADAHGAVDLAAKSGVDAEGFYRAVAEAATPDVRRALFDLLADASEEVATELLTSWASSEASDRQAAQTALLKRLATRDPSTAVELAGTWPNAVNDDVVDALRANSAALGEGGWRRALGVDNEGLRKLAVEELQDSLDETHARELLADPTLLVRVAAVHVVLQRGWSLSREQLEAALKTETSLFGLLSDAANAARNRWADAQAAETLLQQLDWYRFTTAEYRALALNHFDVFEEQLRRDLADHTESFRLESLQSVIERVSAPAALVERELAPQPSTEQFARESFEALALEGLVANSDRAADRELAIARLDSQSRDLRIAAIRLLARLGSEADAPNLVDIARETSGDVSIEAARGALTLAPGATGAAEDLVAIGDPSLARLVLDELKEDDGRAAASLALDLLENTHFEVRRRAVSFVAERLSPEELERLLDLVLEQRRYYYNVVAFLDRLLYAPEPFRSAYGREVSA